MRQEKYLEMEVKWRGEVGQDTAVGGGGEARQS